MSDKKLWGGRFSHDTERLVEEYTESVSFDRALWAEDIAGSKAHARMLAKVGVLTEDEARIIVQGLDEVASEIESGAFDWKVELEDVHMNVEARLTERIGELGGKLHTGRSRNDQVALDFRLHVADRLEDWGGLLALLVSVLARRAEENRDTLLPGLTHLQPAQPVSLAHHLLAYAWMFRRDFERIEDCRKRVRVSPLGAAALAGTTHPLDPEAVAGELGLPEVFHNSMDAVSDRDFAVEALFCACLAMMHLSRLCEEIILWANPAFGYVALPDGYATGSSIMPQKKNPDVCELMRGRTGRVYGGLVSLLTMLKGLPLAYNRDMQEDKEPFFDADRTLAASLRVMAGLLSELAFVPEAMAAALERGHLDATELADYLAARGVPFRQAHRAAGQAVALAESRGVGLSDLSLDELKGLAPELAGVVGQDVFAVLDPAAAVRRRVSPGSTGPESVDAQLAGLAHWLDAILSEGGAA